MPDIAGLTPYIRRALFLPRDKFGRLLRDDPGMPAHVKVDENGMRVVTGAKFSLKTAHKMFNERRGVSADEIERAWQQFVDDNPKMGVGGNHDKKSKKTKR